MMTEYQLMDLFQKLVVLCNRRNTRYIQTENPTTLTDTQAIVLDYILQESRTHDVFAKDLEEFFGIKGSSVNSVVNYLETERFITRELLPEDNRLKRLVPTQRAREHEAWLMETIHNSIVDVFAGFTDEEMQDLKSLMEKMQLNLLSMASSGRPHYARDPKKAYSPAH